METRKEQMIVKLREKILMQALRGLEARGVIWSEIDADGRLRFYATEQRPKPIKNNGNDATLSSTVRKHRRERTS
jgi:hypothetical protein